MDKTLAWAASELEGLIALGLISAAKAATQQTALLDALCIAV